MAKELTGREEWEQLLQSIDTVLFDCDGQCRAQRMRVAQQPLQVFYGRGMEGPWLARKMHFSSFAPRSAGVFVCVI